MRILLLSESIIIIIVLLLSLALMTLAERKVMGVIQRRVGPNKVGYGGILQPISDGLKVRDGMLNEKREEDKGKKIAASLDRRGYQILKKACLRLEFRGLEKEISKMKTLKTRKEKVKGLQFCPSQGYWKSREKSISNKKTEEGEQVAGAKLQEQVTEEKLREGDRAKPRDWLGESRGRSSTQRDGSDRPKGMKESYNQNIGLSNKGDFLDKGGIIVPKRGGSILGNKEPQGKRLQEGKKGGILRVGTGKEETRDRQDIKRLRRIRKGKENTTEIRKGERILILGYEIGWRKEGKIGVKAPIGRIMERVREGGMVKKEKAYPNFRWYTKGRGEIVRRYKEIIEGYLGYYKEVENYKELETILRRVL